MAAEGGTTHRSYRVSRVGCKVRNAWPALSQFLFLLLLGESVVAAGDSCKLQDGSGRTLDSTASDCLQCQSACLSNSNCDVMTWNDISKSREALPKYRCEALDGPSEPSDSALCVLQDVDGEVIGTSSKDCTACSMACATSAKCHTLVWDTQEFKKTATSACKPIPFWEEFYSVENTQAWIEGAQTNPEQFFKTWMDAFGKEYEGEEVAAERQQIWQDNLDYIYSANEAGAIGLVPNEQADKTLEETRNMKAGIPDGAPGIVSSASTGNRRRLDEKKPRQGARLLLEDGGGAGGVNASSSTNATASTGALPTEFDWRKQGMPVKVRDQGECNSCYAFATSTHLEAMLWMADGQDLDLSEHDILDCCAEPTCWAGNTGTCANPRNCGPCNNGWPHAAMTWVVSSGLATEAAMAYKPTLFMPWDARLPGAKTAECAVVGRVQVGEYVEFDQKLDMIFGQMKEEQLMKLVVQRPVVVAMNLEDDNFRFLGPAHTVVSPSRPLTSINHAVVLIGYGTHPVGGPYWLVQNSWGLKWGDGGLARLARTADDPWQVLMYVTAGTLKAGIDPLNGVVYEEPVTPAPAPAQGAPAPAPLQPASQPAPGPSLYDIMEVFGPAPGPDSDVAPAPGPSYMQWAPAVAPAMPLSPSSPKPSPKLSPASPSSASPSFTSPSSPSLRSPSSPSPTLPSPKAVSSSYSLPSPPHLPSPRSPSPSTWIVGSSNTADTQSNGGIAQLSAEGATGGGVGGTGASFDGELPDGTAPAPTP